MAALFPYRVAVSQHTGDIRTRTREVGATFVLTDPVRAGRVLEATAGATSVREVFVVGHHEGATPVDRLFQEPLEGEPAVVAGPPPPPIANE